MTDRQWSAAQLAVFAAVESDAHRHLVIEALAGSGKTTTIVEALTHTREADSCLFVAFNKSIATELATRVPEGVEVSTLHSFGLKCITRAFGRRNIDDRHVAAQLKDLIPQQRYGDGSYEARKAVAKLVSIAKGCLLTFPSELDAAADAYGIDFPRGWDRDRLVRVAHAVLQAEQVDDTGPIDFDDMIWLPVVRNLPIRTFDWVFVDETQDLNPAQLEIVKRAAGDEGRIVAVGDRRQAIYGFRGADRNAIPRMISELSAHVLPLNVTYRCPLAVVAEACELVPQLEAAPGAASGVVRDASETELLRDAQPGDFVISRTNAPLIALCYRWLSSQRKACIKGRDVGQGLEAFIKSTNATTVVELQACVDSWHAAEVRRLTAQDRSTDAVDDKRACVMALSEGCRSVDEVVGRISRLFGDGNEAGAILLTSTHKAKGLEADRVWLLRETYCKWPGQEEDNLLYVAQTRSKHELIYVYAGVPDAAAAE